MKKRILLVGIITVMSVGVASAKCKCESHPKDCPPPVECPGGFHRFEPRPMDCHMAAPKPKDIKRCAAPKKDEPKNSKAANSTAMNTKSSNNRYDKGYSGGK